MNKQAEERSRFAVIDLITPKERHLLYKDELGDTFLLLKYGEVFRYSENGLRVILVSKSASIQVGKICPIFNEWSTDDGLCIFDVDRRNLPQIIALGAHRRRPYINGRWIKEMEHRLGHRIIPYNPKALKDKKEGEDGYI